MTLSTTTAFTESAFFYLERLRGSFNKTNLNAIEQLSEQLRGAWIDGRNVFICGNGGSAANAIHIANDLYGIGACGEGEEAWTAHRSPFRQQWHYYLPGQ